MGGLETSGNAAAICTARFKGAAVLKGTNDMAV